ncbi:MAG: thioredoxin family protein [Campylobacterota bacterium]
MKIVDSKEQIEDIISKGEPVLIYFSGKNCSVCEALKPKVEQKIREQFPKFKLCEIKADMHKELSSHFTVFSIPTITVFFDKKEFIRYGRNVSVPLLLEKIERPYRLFYE